MPAPRCPPIHRPPSEWEAWALRHIEYTKHRPYMIPFDTFKKSSRVSHLGPRQLEQTWKYYLYQELTGRKHRTLIPYW